MKRKLISSIEEILAGFDLITLESVYNALIKLDGRKRKINLFTH